MNAVLFFDLFAATFILFVGMGGYNRGFFKEIGRIISLIFTIWLSITYYVELAEILQQELSVNPYFLLFLSFAIIFIITLIVSRLVVELIDQIIGIRKTRLFNHLFGFVMGVLKGIVAIALILWAFELIPIQHWTDTLYQESRIAKTVKTIRDNSVSLFELEDPANDGKEYIKSLTDDTPPVQIVR
jgi:uncharacterized membrane protein required for colicin V production